MLVHRIGTHVAKESASANHPRPRSSLHQYDWKSTTSIKQLVPQTALFAEAKGKHVGSLLGHPKHHFLVYRTNRHSEDSWTTALSMVKIGGGAVVSLRNDPMGTSQQCKKLLDLLKLKSSLSFSQQQMPEE
jgi:hypothetical protein